jgi:hypothetical protein
MPSWSSCQARWHVPTAVVVRLGMIKCLSGLSDNVQRQAPGTVPPGAGKYVPGAVVSLAVLPDHVRVTATSGGDRRQTPAPGWGRWRLPACGNVHRQRSVFAVPDLVIDLGVAGEDVSEDTVQAAVQAGHQHGLGAPPSPPPLSTIRRTRHTCGTGCCSCSRPGSVLHRPSQAPDRGRT